MNKVSLREEWSQEATFESCSKQFLSQHLYFKATWFRRTYDCAAQVSGYQNVKSPKIYSNRHLFNFSEECHFNAVSHLANVLTVSKFHYVFCSYKSERTRRKCCCKNWTVGKCILQGANFENCSVKSLIVQLLRWQNQLQAPRKPFPLPVLNHLLASVFK